MEFQIPEQDFRVPEQRRSQFVHLHLHTMYSIRDALIKPKALAKRLKELNMDSVAITDHGFLYGIPEFYQELTAEGIKTIIGLETYIAPRGNKFKTLAIDKENYHLVLLCETNEGYQNLLKIASDAGTNGLYYKPRTDKNMLKKHSKGLIALSACIGGEVASLLLADKYDEAKKSALEYNEIFGQGNFYLEIQKNGIEAQDRANELLLKLAEETGIPLIATCDCHYINSEDSATHDILMAIQSGKTIDDPRARSYGTNQLYVKSSDEMWNSLKGYCPEAYFNTNKVAERCKAKLEFGANRVPAFPIPKDYAHLGKRGFLSHLVYNSIPNFYEDNLDEVHERIEYELNVVENMGFLDYFLIVWDFFRFCEEGTMEYGMPIDPNWIPIITGPGRGSGAGSILLYLLGVTEIDPIKYKLLFERFLDPSRISMPDVDSDFHTERRIEVVEYCFRKYGAHSVSQVITFNTMAARSVIRYVGKAINVSPALYDKLAKMIPQKPGMTIDKALKVNPDLAAIYESDEVAKNLIDTAKKLEGIPQSAGTHAAAVLIVGPEGLEEYVPLSMNDQVIVCQYSKDHLENLGLLKMDFLGLRNLNVMGEALDLIKERHGIKLTLNDIYKKIGTDTAPFKLLEEGKTVGVFQLEGEGMTQFMMELHPKTIEDIIAGISLYRPGPMDEIPHYLANKRNPESITYMFPELEEILKDTYGIICYQEQCMHTVVQVAGYDKSDSDGFRKVISKKKEKEIPMHERWFIEGRDFEDTNYDGRIKKYKNRIPGGMAKGYKKEDLQVFFNLMREFGKYAFNKSHAAAYAFIAWATMYLAYYYPEEFMSALLNSVQGNKDKVSRYINYCRRTISIDIVYPDINISREKFYPTNDGRIACSLQAKGVTKDSLAAIIVERDKNGPYTSMEDFFERTLFILDKATYESLISIGAFTGLGINKASLLAGLDDTMKKLGGLKSSVKNAMSKNKAYPVKKRISEIMNVIPRINEMPKDIELRLEKKFLGVFLTGNPIDRFAYTAKTQSNFSLKDLDYTVDEETGEIKIYSDARSYQKVTMIGVIDELKPIVTKKNTLMAVGQVQDLDSTAKIIFWPSQYTSIRNQLKEGRVYKIDGQLNISDDEAPFVSCNSLEELTEEALTERVIITLDNPFELKKIIQYIKRNPVVRGRTPLYIKYDNITICSEVGHWINTERFDFNNLNYKIERW